MVNTRIYRSNVSESLLRLLRFAIRIKKRPDEMVLSPCILDCQLDYNCRQSDSNVLAPHTESPHANKSGAPNLAD